MLAPLCFIVILLCPAGGQLCLSHQPSKLLSLALSEVSEYSSLSILGLNEDDCDDDALHCPKPQTLCHLNLKPFLEPRPRPRPRHRPESYPSPPQLNGRMSSLLVRGRGRPTH